MNKQKIAKVYKVINSVDDMIYIGSSSQSLVQRMSQHRVNARNINKQSKFYKHMRTVGIEYFSIVVIKLLPDKTNDEVITEEFNEIITYPPDKLLNENVIFKQFSTDHKNKLSESHSGSKAGGWNFGSIYRGSKNEYSDVWIYKYRIAPKKDKMYSFSVKKYGEDVARQMAMDKRKEIYPDATDINF